MSSKYEARYNLHHICPGCDAEAVRAPALAPETGQIVTVPHGPDCPVAAQAAQLRARAQEGAQQ